MLLCSHSSLFKDIYDFALKIFLKNLVIKLDMHLEFGINVLSKILTICIARENVLFLQKNDYSIWIH